MSWQMVLFLDLPYEPKVEGENYWKNLSKSKKVSKDDEKIEIVLNKRLIKG